MINKKSSFSINQEFLRTTLEPLLGECEMLSEAEDIYSLFLLCSCIWDNNQPVDGHIQQQRSHGGVEDSTGQQLISQMDWEQVGLICTCQPT